MTPQVGFHIPVLTPFFLLSVNLPSPSRLFHLGPALCVPSLALHSVPSTCLCCACQCVWCREGTSRLMASGIQAPSLLLLSVLTRQLPPGIKTSPAVTLHFSRQEGEGLVTWLEEGGEMWTLYQCPHARCDWGRREDAGPRSSLCHGDGLATPGVHTACPKAPLCEALCHLRGKVLSEVP